MPTITSAHDLITAVPFLLGFHPSHSLVVIAMHSNAQDNSLGMALRIDLPPSLDSDHIDLLAHHVLRDGADSAVCVAYAPSSRTDIGALLIALTAGFMRNKILVRDAIVVSGGRYKSIICNNHPTTSDSDKALPDIESSAIAAEHVVMGVPMPFGSVEEMAEIIAPLSRAAEPEWIAQVETFRIDESSPHLSELRRDGVSTMELLFDHFHSGLGISNYTLAARMIGRMSDIQVRDFAMGIHHEDTFDTYFALWCELARLAPAGYLAPIASIVAAMAYENGNGALAHKALDRAFSDDEKYPLAQLLRRVFNAGWPPSEFARMRTELHPKVMATIFGEPFASGLN